MKAVGFDSRWKAASKSSRLLGVRSYLYVYILTSVLIYGHMLPLVFEARSS
jgi:hypothetical protein